MASCVSWISFALLCYGPLHGHVFRVYSNLARNIVQASCGREVGNELIYTLAPGVCRFRNAEFDTKIQIDSDGFRNAPEDRGSGPLSVAVLGDSFAMGWGVEQGEKIASLLARDPRLAVRDLSMSSYGTVRELFALQRHASGARVVVLQYCQNDVAENTEFLLDPRAFVAHAANRRAEFETLRRSEIEPGRVRSALRTLLASASRGLVATWRAIALPPRPQPATPPTVLADEARLFAAVLAHFRATLADRDVIVFDLHARRVREGMDDAMRVALARVGLSRVRVVDLEGVLDMEDYFHLDEHLNASGHAALARRLIEELDQIEALEGPVKTAGLSIPVEPGTKLGAFVESGAVRGR